MRANGGTQAVRATEAAAARGASQGTNGAHETERTLNQAWRILDQVNSLIHVADTKAGVVLATSGVAGGTLYSLIHGGARHGFTLGLFATVTALLLTGSAVCAGCALRPRRDGDGPRGAANLIFFDHIARMSGDEAEGYPRALNRLLLEPDELAGHIVEQIWVNAKVASAKYTWVERALALLCWAVPAFVAVAVAAVI